MDEDSAFVVAYSDQFVDDCRSDTVCPFQVGRRLIHPRYTADYANWSAPATWYGIYIPFHFVPGPCDMNPLSVVAGGKIVTKALQDAIESGGMYRVGVALHAYQDSFSHRDFSGVREDWNSVYDTFDPRSIAPNIGHAEVGGVPDDYDGEWHDHRFKQRRMNRRDFIACYRFLRTIFFAGRTKPASGAPMTLGWFNHDWNNGRIQYSIAKGCHEYSPEEWPARARKTRPQHYHHSHFARFQKAAAAHADCVSGLLRDNGIVIG